jgi:hypothetical protein
MWRGEITRLEDAMDDESDGFHSLARSRRREALARLFAADKMALLGDPLGANLPHDLWSQMLEKADATLCMIRTGAASRG